nr:hypothetical protein [Tanacetum cinerariifolium]
MKMEQYLAHTDYALWEVILNGNIVVQMTKDEVESTSRTNELNATYSVSTATGLSSQAQGLEQIDQNDLEEIDLKWQVSMLSMKCHRRGHFARDCRSVRNSGNRSRDAENAGYKGRDNGKRPVKEEDEQALVVQDGFATYDWSNQVEEEATDFALMAFTSNPSSSSSSNSEREKLSKANIESKEEVTKTMFNNRSSDEENSVANDRFKKGEGYHAVPLPLTGNYMPPKPDLSFARLDDSIYKFKISDTVTSLAKDNAPETSTACVAKPKEDRFSAPLIED